jgi:hypothetical protein
MPVGRFSYKGGTPGVGGGNVAGTVGTLALRAAAKAGLGAGGKSTAPSQPDPILGKALADTFGFKQVKFKQPNSNPKTSMGRQNVAVVKTGTGKDNGTPSRGAVVATKVPKSKPRTKT